MTAPPFLMVKGDYFTGLTASGIIRWMKVHDHTHQKAREGSGIFIRSQKVRDRGISGSHKHLLKRLSNSEKMCPIGCAVIEHYESITYRHLYRAGPWS